MTVYNYKKSNGAFLAKRQHHTFPSIVTSIHQPRCNVPLISTELHLNNSVPETCEYQDCNFLATNYSRILWLPEYVLFCDHCKINLTWHCIAEELSDNEHLDAGLTLDRDVTK